jgi:uncharacterized protein with GYD domain
VANYVILGKFTQQGIETIKDGTGRRNAAKEVAKSLGGDLKHVYLTFGQYDLVTVAEFPDDEAAATAAMRIGMRGNLSTQTLRAFDESETDRILAAV